MEGYKEKIKELINNTGIGENEVFNYEDDDLKDEFDNIFNFYQENLDLNSKYGIGPSIIFFNKNTTVNAKAGKDSNSGYYIISMNMGTVLSMWNMFQIKEDLIEELTNKDYFEFEKSLDVYINNLMYQMAIHFTFYHEMGHLVQKSDLLETGLYEHLDNTDGYDEVKHLLELDADEFSSLSIAVHILQYAESIFGFEITKEQFQKLLRIACSAIFLYLLSFPSYRRKLYFNKFDHPHPVIRIMWIVSTIVRHCKDVLEAKGIDLQLTPREIIDETFSFIETISQKFFDEDIITKYKETINENRDEIIDYLIYFQRMKENNKTLACYKWNVLANKARAQVDDKEDDTLSTSS